MGCRILRAFSSALLLTGGSLGDLYGRRKVLAIGVVLFSAASAWRGVAANIGELIAARGLQGVGGRFWYQAASL